MIWWWWILPAVVGALGLILFVSSVAGLFRGRFVSGLFGTAFGGAAMFVAAVVALGGLNLQTYGRLTYERPVATLLIKRLGPQYFEATVIQPAMGENQPATTAVYPLHGDEWRIEAQVLKWKPWANVLGLDSQYRLDRLSGRYQSIEQEINATRSVHSLRPAEPDTPLPWRVDVWDAARKYRKWVDPVDTLYGGAAYMPMADGARYEVWLTQSGLIARPANAEARDASAGGWTVVN